MLAILAKDLRIELRTREGVSSLAVLGLLVLLVFQFAFPERPTPEAAAAALWLAFVLAGTIGAQRTFLLERENACMHGLVTAPLDPAMIFVAKMLGNVVILTVLQFLVVPLTVVFFNVTPTGHLGWLAVVCFLGNVGFSAVTTLFAAISVRIRAREVMLPLLVLPLVSPLLIASVKASARLLGDGSAAEVSVWIQVLAAFDVIFTASGWLLFEYVVRE